MKTNPSHDVIFIAPLVCCIYTRLQGSLITYLILGTKISKIFDICKYFGNYFLKRFSYEGKV